MFVDLLILNVHYHNDKEKTQNTESEGTSDRVCVRAVALGDLHLLGSSGIEHLPNSMVSQTL